MRAAIADVLNRYSGLVVMVPLNRPPDPAAGRGRSAPAPAPAADAEPPLVGPPSPVRVQSPYFINRGTGDGGSAGGRRTLSGRGVQTWFNGLPGAVRVGKGSPEQMEAALQQAVDGGLLNAAWPPGSQQLHEFMRETGVGVDCSGFVYTALMAADAALTDAGMAGLTSPQTSNIVNSGSQSIGRGGGTRVTAPADLRAGDIIQMAPNAGNPVGHIRIITTVTPGPDFVVYETAESTTRVGHGPQASTWRLPARGPMDTAHLEVRDDTTQAWSRESTGRPSSYWRRLAVPAAAGPAPVARVARSPAPVARRGVRALARDAPRSGGWNEGDRGVAGTWRIPITGLTQGLARNNAHAATAEEAQHSAVAIVPRTVAAANLEVLLHFHGNNLGSRERLNQSESGMGRGTVRDVEGDLIPQQLAGSGRNMIAILPQGRVSSGNLDAKFGITDPRAYATEVLGHVVTHVNALDPARQLQALRPVRIVVSGHSGGGPASVEAASGLQATSQSADDEWVAAPPLMLFDAINGLDELRHLTRLVAGWLDEDRRRLLAKPESEATQLLNRRGLKLRSTYTSGVYHATNSKRDPRTYQYPPRPPVTVPASESLEAKLDAWFAANTSRLGALAPILRRQYVVEHVSGTHDYTVGAGSRQTGPRTAVPGVTQGPGAPAGSNEAPANASGNLATGLSQLSPADQIVPAAPAVARSAAVGRELARAVAARHLVDEEAIRR